MAQIRTSGGRVTGVTLGQRGGRDAPVVVTTVHPKISFLQLVDPAVLPGEFVADIRGWRSRSGTVKMNLALDRMPVFASRLLDYDVLLAWPLPRRVRSSPPTCCCRSGACWRDALDAGGGPGRRA